MCYFWIYKGICSYDCCALYDSSAISLHSASQDQWQDIVSGSRALEWVCMHAHTACPMYTCTLIVNQWHYIRLIFLQLSAGWFFEPLPAYLWLWSAWTCYLLMTRNCLTIFPACSCLLDSQLLTWICLTLISCCRHGLVWWVYPPLYALPWKQTALDSPTTVYLQALGYLCSTPEQPGPRPLTKYVTAPWHSAGKIISAMTNVLLKSYFI